MAQFTERQLKRYEIASLVIIAAGLVVALLCRLPHDPLGFWDNYIRTTQGAGEIAVLAGLAILALSLTRHRTAFFSLDRKIDAEPFGATLAVIAIASIVLILLVLPQLPSTPVNQLPPDPNIREGVLSVERNFRVFVAAAIALTGGSIALFPCIQFFRRG